MTQVTHEPKNSNIEHKIRLNFQYKILHINYNTGHTWPVSRNLHVITLFNKGTEHVARGTCLPARGHVTSCVYVSSLQTPDVTADKNYINNTELDLVISTPVNNVASLRFRVRVLISDSVRRIAVFSF